MSSSKNFIFRRAEALDMKNVREMIQELADFEKMSNGPEITEKDLIKDSGLDGDKEYCHIYIVELEKDETADKIPIGYSICFIAYSTWQGKTYFLEDIYIKPAYRKLGAGAFVFRQVAAKAKEYQCRRLDFHVLGWNPACDFYKRMSAVDLTKSEEWHFFRVNKEQIEKLAKEAKE